MHAHKLWVNARLATMGSDRQPYGAIEPGALAERDGRILWIGTMADLPAIEADEQVDLEGRWITPGLIDCHTHLVFAGNRAGEFEQRRNGMSYADIAAAGGGILSTVKATRSADEDELLRQSLPRLDALIAEGVTTVEIKSGYGLDAENETKMLRVARRLAEMRPVTIVTTYLGAHCLPPEVNGDSAAYLDDICDRQLPAIAEAGLADAVDAFCETIAFDCDEVRRVYEKADSLQLALKIHAEQLSLMGGAALAAGFGALSADHLEYLDESGVAALATAGTAAVLLPGAFYFLSERQLPPIALLRSHGVPMAVATDCNPGSSPLNSLLLAMNMGCVLFALTPEEALAGVTRVAAGALGLGTETGSLEVGKSCDLAIWDIGHPAELAYGIGYAPIYRRVWKGRWTS